MLSAQNWAPINTTDIYNYKADTASAISHSLWADSKGFDGTDSVYYPNRIVKHITHNLALKNQPQFLNKQVTVKGNGLYLFSAPSTISYYSWAALNDVYTFDSTHNITATVTAVEEATILGNLDSIKTILLSSGDTIIASKEHGFVQFPMEYGSGKYYRLVGIEGSRNIGEHVMRFGDFFNYSVGDTFWYYRYENYMTDVAIIEDRRKIAYAIDTIVSVGDTVIYQFLPNGEKNFNILLPENEVNLVPNELHPILSYSQQSNSPYKPTYNAPISVYSVWNDDVGHYPSCPASGSKKYYVASTSFSYNGHTTVKRFDKFYCQSDSMSDTLRYLTHLNFGDNYGNKQFVERLGMTYMNAMGFETNGLLMMYAYRLAGDTTITILDQRLFDLLIGVEAPTAPAFSILGNPVTTTLSIQLPSPDAHTLTLYHLNGQLLVRQHTQQTNISIDVAHLPQGIYLLEVRNQTGVSRQRVVKM